jgi:hypothetical protein
LDKDKSVAPAGIRTQDHPARGLVTVSTALSLYNVSLKDVNTKFWKIIPQGFVIEFKVMHF